MGLALIERMEDLGDADKQIPRSPGNKDIFQKARHSFALAQLWNSGAVMPPTSDTVFMCGTNVVSSQSTVILGQAARYGSRILTPGLPSNSPALLERTLLSTLYGRLA